MDDPENYDMTVTSHIALEKTAELHVPPLISQVPGLLTLAINRLNIRSQYRQLSSDRWSEASLRIPCCVGYELLATSTREHAYVPSPFLILQYPGLIPFIFFPSLGSEYIYSVNLLLHIKGPYTRLVYVRPRRVFRHKRR